MKTGAKREGKTDLQLDSSAVKINQYISANLMQYSDGNFCYHVRNEEILFFVHSVIKDEKAQKTIIYIGL